MSFKSQPDLMICDQCNVTINEDELYYCISAHDGAYIGNNIKDAKHLFLSKDVHFCSKKHMLDYINGRVD
jgi:hypothetical protein